ncbi:MAG: serine/threonine-protein kinase [Myxococcota bacterium]
MMVAEPGAEPDLGHSFDDASTRRVPTPAEAKGSGSQDTETQQRIAARVRERLFSGGWEPQRIGRYLVLEPIGRGGMGNVYAAYDDLLDRKIAVKVLRDEEFPGEDDRYRFLREAQALARLSHPNVVAVHEVGHSDDELFIAMEFVRGQSLAQWLKTSPPWLHVLEAFVQAGRGLAAAHQAELVHRDIKPSNIVRGDDGAIKVLDFGLAYVTPTAEVDRADLSGPGSLTLPGTVMGTPAYMSPEQHGGGLADARADQYGYCVALWEGLTGARPFDAREYTALVSSKLEGPPPWPTAGPAVPRRIVDALRRGLAPDPGDRWPSMERLLDALAWDPRRRRTVWLQGLMGATVLGLGGTTLYLGSRESAPPPCTGAREQLAGVWDEARQTEVLAAVLAVDQAYAPAVWERTARELDTYAEQWASMHQQACEATTVRGERSPRMLDLRMRCLDRASVDLQTTVDTLAAVDEAVVQRAHELVAGLRPLSRCADTAALEAEVEPPLPHEAEAVEAIRLELSRSESLERVGRYDAARAAVEEAAAALEGLDYAPIRTEVRLREGLVLEHLGEYEASEAALDAALALAARWRQHEAMATAASGLLYVVGYQRRQAEGLRYWSIAEGLSHGRPQLEALARNNRALVLGTRGEHERAEAEHRRVLALYTEIHGSEHPRVAAARNNLAIALAQQGELAEAEAEFRAAFELRKQTLGPAHPHTLLSHGNVANVLAEQGDLPGAESEIRAVLLMRQQVLGLDHISVAHTRNNLGGILAGQGKYEQAEAEIRAAIGPIEQLHGPLHPDVAMTRFQLGAVLKDQGRLDEAEVELRTAITRWSERLGAGHPDVARGRGNLSGVLLAQGRLDQAEVEARAALEIRVEALGPEHPAVATSRHALADVLRARGEFARAEAEFRVALEVGEQARGADHPDTQSTRLELVAVLLELEREDEALPLAERAWTHGQRDQASPASRGEAAFVLARVLAAVGGSARAPARALARAPARARELAEDARRSFIAAGAEFDGRAAAVGRWLDVHPSG